MTEFFVNGKCFAQRTTGVQRYAAEMIRALDRLLTGAPPAAPWVLWLPPGAAAPSLQTIQARALPFTLPGGLHPWEQWTLPRASRRGLLLNLAGAAPAFARRQACVLHDAAVFDHPEAYTPAFRSWYRWLFRRLARRASPAMTISRFSQARLSLALQVPTDRFRLLSAGADHLDVVAEAPSVLARHGLDRQPFLLAVGSLNPTKNLAALVRAWQRLGRPDARLALVGGRHGAVFAGDGLRPTEGVVALGAVDDAALKALYRRAAGLVFPSLYEGFGLPPLEAMACGCPVAAARAASLPEACGDAALMFDPHDEAAIADAMARLLDDAALTDRLRTAGRTRAQALTWDRAAAGLLQTLAEADRSVA